MHQLINALSRVALEPGVVQGLMVEAVGGPTPLRISADKGIAKVGTLQDDASITNRAALGFNQPGRKIETAIQTLDLVAATGVPGDLTRDYFVFLKTDGSLEAAQVPASGDPNEVAPEYGPDPFRGVLLVQQMQEGPIRRRESACALIARVSVDTLAVTAVDNTVRNTALI